MIFDPYDPDIIGFATWNFSLTRTYGRCTSKSRHVTTSKLVRYLCGGMHIAIAAAACGCNLDEQLPKQ